MPHMPAPCRNFVFAFELYGVLQEVRSFPTRRSSDLRRHGPRTPRGPPPLPTPQPRRPGAAAAATRGDRKSTRLNSSHVAISYAAFCLKKKTRGRNKYDTVLR